jgi:hypothetical protein
VNVRVDGVPVSVAGVTAPPLNAMLKLEFEAFDVMETLPLKLFAEGGIKLTVNDPLCPSVSVSGALIPDMLNPVPLTVAAEIVAFAPPVFFTVSVCV